MQVAGDKPPRPPYKVTRGTTSPTTNIQNLSKMFNPQLGVKLTQLCIYLASLPAKAVKSPSAMQETRV